MRLKRNIYIVVSILFKVYVIFLRYIDQDAIFTSSQQLYHMIDGPFDYIYFEMMLTQIVIKILVIKYSDKLIHIILFTKINHSSNLQKPFLIIFIFIMDQSSIPKRKFIIKSPKSSPTTKTSAQLYYSHSKHLINTLIQPDHRQQLYLTCPQFNNLTFIQPLNKSHDQNANPSGNIAHQIPLNYVNEPNLKSDHSMIDGNFKNDFKNYNNDNQFKEQNTIRDFQGQNSHHYINDVECDENENFNVDIIDYKIKVEGTKNQSKLQISVDELKQTKMEPEEICQNLRSEHQQSKQRVEEEKPESEQNLVNSDSIIRDKKYESQYRPYLIQYIVIVYHFDSFVDLKQIENMKKVLDYVYPEKKKIRICSQLINTKLLYFHKQMLEKQQKIPAIINSILKTLKILEEEYNEARKAVAVEILKKYSQCLKRVPRSNKQLKQMASVKIGKLQKQVSNLLSNQNDLKAIFEFFEKFKQKDQLKKQMKKQKEEQKRLAEKQRIQNMIKKRKEDEKKESKRLKMQYIFRVILTEIYSKKYDIQKNEEHIDSLAENIYLHYIIKHEFHTRQQCGQAAKKIIKENHFDSLKQYGTVQMFIHYANQTKIKSEERHQAKHIMAYTYFKMWYQKIICKIQIPKNHFFNHLYKEIQKYSSCPQAFIEDPENLFLLVRLLNELKKQEEKVQQFKEYEKSHRFVRPSPNQYKWFLFLIKQTRDINTRKIWPILYFQHLISLHSERLTIENIHGKSSLQIFTYLRQIQQSQNKSQMDIKKEAKQQKVEAVEIIVTKSTKQEP